VFPLALAAVLAVAYLPAVLLPPADGPVRPRRDDVALSVSAVLTLLAAGLTVWSGYFVVIAPPFVAFPLAVLVAGLVGRRPLACGMTAVGVYVGVVLGFLAPIGLTPAGLALVGLVPLATGAAGAASVAGVWRLRRRLH
jgi:hypothetical protein